MKFQLRLAFLVSAVTLVAAGPFTIRWFSGSGCGGSSLGCNSINSFECCEEPPSPSSFPYMRATSSGPAGFVVFTEVTQTGGCGLCTSTGSLNTCYLNSPFDTAMVVSISQCQHTKVKRDGSPGSTDAKLPAFERHNECNSSRPIDTAVVDGFEYDLSGPEDRRLAAIQDFYDLSGTEFEAKYAKPLNRRAVDPEEAPRPTPTTRTLAFEA